MHRVHENRFLIYTQYTRYILSLYSIQPNRLFICYMYPNTASNNNSGNNHRNSSVQYCIRFCFFFLSTNAMHAQSSEANYKRRATKKKKNNYIKLSVIPRLFTAFLSFCSLALCLYRSLCTVQIVTLEL